jgi:ABC-2 type transport system permease protein
VAVYERNYRSYSGDLTPQRTRFLVLPRYAYQEVFKSKLFIAFLVACGIWPLALSVMIYLPHNLKFLSVIDVESADIARLFGNFDAQFFFGWFMVPFSFVSVVVTFLVGPALISADLRNNGLPLYLSRPFNRAEYILGKAAVLIILLSLVTWVPGLLLFVFQSYMGGMEWFREHWSIGIAIFLSSWIQILLLCLLSLAISAYVKVKPLARITLIGVFFVAKPLSLVLTVLLRTEWASVISIVDMIRVVWSGLFGVAKPVDVPIWAAWLSLLSMCAIALWMLHRKVRAYEVVRT